MAPPSCPFCGSAPASQPHHSTVLPHAEGAQGFLPPSLPPCGPMFLLPSQVSMAKDRHVRGVRAEVVKPRGLAPHLSVFFPTLVKGD